jgi:hypothetical protein
MATQWTAGLSALTPLPAATLNTIGAAWETWTPTITQTGNVTFTASATSTYAQVQKIVFGSIYLTVSGTGTGASNVVVSLPVTAKQTAVVVGQGFIFDSSATNLYTCTAVTSTTTSAFFFVTGNGGNPFGIGPNIALAASDQIRISFMYEAA